MAQQLEYEVVDTFTDFQYTFSGEPIVLIYLPASIVITPARKVKLARRFGFLATAFVHEDDGHDLHWTVDCRFTHGGFEFSEHGRETSVATYDRLSRIATISVAHDAHEYGTVTSCQLIKYQPELADFWDDEGNVSYPLVGSTVGKGFALVDLDSVKTLESLKPPCHGSATTVQSEDNQDWVANSVGTLYFVAQRLDLTTERIGTSKIRARLFSHDGQEHIAPGYVACLLCARLSIGGVPSGNSSRSSIMNLQERIRMRTSNRYEMLQGDERGRMSVMIVEVVRKNTFRPEIDHILLQGRAVKVMDGVLEL